MKLPLQAGVFLGDLDVAELQRDAQRALAGLVARARAGVGHLLHRSARELVRRTITAASGHGPHRGESECDEGRDVLGHEYGRLVDRLVVVSGGWPHPNPALGVAKLAVVGSEV
eukprot:scaffold143297_cov136-Phaeocystis_antarctica.AAC.1